MIELNEAAIIEASQLLIKEVNGEDLGVYGKNAGNHAGRPISFFYSKNDKIKKQAYKIHAILWFRINYGLGLVEAKYHAEQMMSDAKYGMSKHFITW